MKLETIPNKYPQLTTRVSMTYPFAQLCPVSGEPQPSSTLTISYDAGACLLETKALRRYLDSFAGENIHDVRDLEEAAQVIAQACANTLDAPVVVRAHYELLIGSMDVEVLAMSDSANAA
jgi:NADPH-dependent 7-cyano-7-deazaguanine reductase QueF